MCVDKLPTWCRCIPQGIPDLSSQANSYVRWQSAQNLTNSYLNNRLLYSVLCCFFCHKFTQSIYFHLPLSFLPLKHWNTEHYIGQGLDWRLDTAGEDNDDMTSGHLGETEQQNTKPGRQDSSRKTQACNNCWTSDRALLGTSSLPAGDGVRILLKSPSDNRLDSPKDACNNSLRWEYWLYILSLVARQKLPR